MENKTQEKTNPKIITDPDKLKKSIKYSGLFGIILGALIVISAVAMYIYSATGVSLVTSSVTIIFAALYIIFGFQIRKNPTKAKKPTQRAIALSVIVNALTLIGVLMGGQMSLLSWLIFAHLFELVHSLKYVKRLEVQQGAIK